MTDTNDLLKKYIEDGGKIKKLSENSKTSKKLKKEKRKELRKMEKDQKVALLKRKSLILQSNLNQDELWFKKLFQKDLATNQDKYKYLFSDLYTPFIINFNKKYVIELITNKQPINCPLKDFKLFTVISNDLNDYKRFKKEYKEYIQLTSK